MKSFQRGLRQLMPITQSFADRLLVLRKRWRLVVRLTVATGSAFWIATHVLGHEQAFFAPVAAVIALTAGAGQRARVVFELVLGVALGVLVGELLILQIGRGWWQIALVAGLTLAAATLAGVKGIGLTQAVNSGVLLAAIVPVTGANDPAITRFLDALIGGFAGLAMTVVLPRHPVRDIDRDVQLLLSKLAGILHAVAESLRVNDAGLADQALARARATQPLIDQVASTARNVAEVARMAPMRWRQRDAVQRYAGSVADLDNAVRDSRVLARRASAMLRHDEQLPMGVVDAIDSLARAVGIYADDLAQDTEFDQARQELVAAARLAIVSLPGVLTINAAAVASQVRSLAADLLMASGVDRAELDEMLDF